MEIPVMAICKILFLPYLSLSVPNTGAPKNCIKEKLGHQHKQYAHLLWSWSDKNSIGNASLE